MADNYYYQLNSTRNLESEHNQIMSEAGQVIQPPSGGRYAALYFMAIVGDILDIFVGLSFIVDLLLMIPMLMLGHRTGLKSKAMKKFSRDLAAKARQIENSVMAMRRTYARALKVARRTRVLRRPAARLAKFAKFGKRSRAFMKIFWSVILDLVPVLGWIPFRTWSIYSSKKEEREAYEEAREMLPIYTATAQERAAAIQELNETMTVEAMETAAQEQAIAAAIEDQAEEQFEQQLAEEEYAEEQYAQAA